MRKFALILLIAALLAPIGALAETDFGLLPGMTWESTPDEVMALLGPDADVSYMQSDSVDTLYMTNTDIFGLEDSSDWIVLIFDSGSGAFDCGYSAVQGIEAQALMDAISAYCGEPIMLGEHEYWCLDAFLESKALCYWACDGLHTIVLTRFENPENTDASDELGLIVYDRANFATEFGGLDALDGLEFMTDEQIAQFYESAE